MTRGPCASTAPRKGHQMIRARSTLVAATLLTASLALVGGAWAGSSSARPARVADNQTVRIALDYSANVNYLGIYVAIDKGFFARQGITAKIIPYANTPAETLVESGNTDLGISYPPDVIINRAKGLEYKAVAALVAAEHDRARRPRVLPVHPSGAAQRQALRRLRHRERSSRSSRRS